MKRFILDKIATDLSRKMVFLTGPRQSGKSTLAQALASNSDRYPVAQVLNWDVADDRHVMLERRWRPDAQLIVLDELHKMNDWRAWLKGTYDGRQPGQTFLVTGSARLDAFSRSGESLAGRYFSWRLHPVTVAEYVRMAGVSSEDALDRLLERGGFPEPLLGDSAVDADRWRRLYIDGVVRDDILEFSRLREVQAMRLFIDMIRSRVGSPLSLASLARDLQVSPTTLAGYLGILEALHIVFVVRPFHRNISRAILKEPKVYFFDTGLVDARLSEGGARFENACAAMLLRHVHFLQDAEGREVTLRYVRDKEGREVDFVVCEGDEPLLFAESKLTDAQVPNLLKSLAERFPQARATLVVRHLRQPQQQGRVSVERASAWLASLSA